MLKQKDLKRATLIEACIKVQCTVKQVIVGGYDEKEKADPKAYNICIKE